MKSAVFASRAKQAYFNVITMVDHGQYPEWVINRQEAFKLAGVAFAGPLYEISDRNHPRRLGHQYDFRISIGKPVDAGLRDRGGARILLYPTGSIKSHPGGPQSSQQCSDAKRVI